MIVSYCLVRYRKLSEAFSESALAPWLPVRIIAGSGKCHHFACPGKPTTSIWCIQFRNVTTSTVRQLTPMVYWIISVNMRTSCCRIRNLTLTGALALVSTVWIVGIGIFDGVCQDQITTETEEAKELAEQDDADHFSAVVDHEVMLIHGHCFDEWLQTVHETALLSHSWRWCSRGPPAV